MNIPVLQKMPNVDTKTERAVFGVKKILMVSRDPEILTAGSEARTRIMRHGRLVRELHVVVCSQKRPNIEARQIKEGNVFIYPTDSRWRLLYGVDAIRVGSRILSRQLTPFETEKSASASEFLITSQDPFDAGLASWVLAKMYRLKLELQIHADFLSPYFARESLSNWARVKVALFLIPRASCIRVVSQRIKDALSAKLTIGRRGRSGRVLRPAIQVLPVYIDVNKITNVSKNPDLRIDFPQFDAVLFMASRIVRGKNIELALEALKEILIEFPRAGLVIAGSGPELQRMKNYASDLGVLLNTVFLGKVNNLVPYYKAADMFLITSNHEGYAAVLVEAALSGCPIVTTDVGIVGEVFKHEESALVCTPGDGVCVARSALSFLKDPALGKRIAERAKNAAEEAVLAETEYMEKQKTMWEKCGENF